MNPEMILKRIQEDRVQFISFQFTTIEGAMRQLVHPARKLERILETGLGFDGSSCHYVPVHQSDLMLKPDLDTYRVLPWGGAENRTARLICDVYSADGRQPFDADPRIVLKRNIARMQERFGRAWDLILAPEIEFFLLEKDPQGQYVPHDRGTYFDTPPYDRSTELRKDLSRALDAVGIAAEKNHHEVPHGKSEINFACADALTTADNTMTYRHVVKMLAAERGLVATFMPKPFVWTYGCGMHVHLNLKDRETGRNLFHDAGSPDGLSQTARRFIAGLLVHARPLSGITNPTVNSYKRLVPGWEAPVYVSWGYMNRSSLLRIPASQPEAIRVETRNPDSSCNPYLAFSAILAAGLDGIEKGLEPPAPVNDNIYSMTEARRAELGIEELPADLREALNAFKADSVLREALGEDLVSRFLALKEKEAKAFATTVHPWELETYINV